MEITITLEGWSPPALVTSTTQGFAMNDRSGLIGHGGVYLIWAQPATMTDEVFWYVGQSGDMGRRLGDYERRARLITSAAGTLPDDTETRVAAQVLKVLAAGGTAKYRTIEEAVIFVPAVHGAGEAQLAAQQGGQVTGMRQTAPLSDTANRHLAESAAIVHLLVEAGERVREYTTVNQLDLMKGTTFLADPWENLMLTFPPAPSKVAVAPAGPPSGS